MANGPNIFEMLLVYFIRDVVLGVRSLGLILNMLAILTVLLIIFI